MVHICEKWNRSIEILYSVLHVNVNINVNVKATDERIISINLTLVSGSPCYGSSLESVRCYLLVEVQQMPSAFVHLYIQQVQLQRSWTAHVHSLSECETAHLDRSWTFTMCSYGAVQLRVNFQNSQYFSSCDIHLTFTLRSFSECDNYMKTALCECPSAVELRCTFNTRMSLAVVNWGLNCTKWMCAPISGNTDDSKIARDYS